LGKVGKKLGARRKQTLAYNDKVQKLSGARGVTLKPPEGFTALFNGKDLTGWRAPRKGGKDDWGVGSAAGTPGVLSSVQVGIGAGHGDWLMTEKEYGDFELRLEFKVYKGANSGVALRAPLKGNPAEEGMEIQILDDPSHKGLKEWQHTGSIYGVVPPTKVATRAVGEWNRYRIVCKGRQVTVELNDEKVVDANLDAYKKTFEKVHPGILRDRGHIGLQRLAGRVEFRNIFIKELEPEVPAVRVALGANLIANPDAEAGKADEKGTELVDIPGWRRKGKATVVPYRKDRPGWTVLPAPDSPGPRERGKNLFIGGPEREVAELTQELDVTTLAGKIDTGRLVYELSAYLGGYANQEDHAVLAVTFLGGEGMKLGEAQVGPVTAKERKGATGLLPRVRTGKVPAGVRKLSFRLTFTHREGGYNDGSADNLSLVIKEPRPGDADK
jgi:hypothetical protein